LPAWQSPPLPALAGCSWGIEKATTLIHLRPVALPPTLPCSWGAQLRQLEFQELIQFLQKPPTSGWGEKDIELVLSRAYMWRASFKGAASHFS
jgi:hypothetical protein